MAILSRQAQSVIKEMNEADNIVTSGKEKPLDVKWVEQRKPIENAGMTQRFSLYIQHLILPVVVDFWAIFWILVDWQDVPADFTYLLFGPSIV